MLACCAPPKLEGSQLLVINKTVSGQDLTSHLSALKATRFSPQSQYLKGKDGVSIPLAMKFPNPGERVQAVAAAAARHSALEGSNAAQGPTALETHDPWHHHMFINSQTLQQAVPQKNVTSVLAVTPLEKIAKQFDLSHTEGVHQALNSIVDYGVIFKSAQAPQFGSRGMRSLHRSQMEAAFAPFDRFRKNPDTNVAVGLAKDFIAKNLGLDKRASVLIAPRYSGYDAVVDATLAPEKFKRQIATATALKARNSSGVSRMFRAASTAHPFPLRNMPVCTACSNLPAKGVAATRLSFRLPEVGTHVLAGTNTLCGSCLTLQREALRNPSGWDGYQRRFSQVLPSYSLQGTNTSLDEDGAASSASDAEFQKPPIELDANGVRLGLVSVFDQSLKKEALEESVDFTGEVFNSMIPAMIGGGLKMGVVSFDDKASIGTGGMTKNPEIVVKALEGIRASEKEGKAYARAISEAKHLLEGFHSHQKDLVAKLKPGETGPTELNSEEDLAKIPNRYKLQKIVTAFVGPNAAESDDFKGKIDALKKAGAQVLLVGYGVDKETMDKLGAGADLTFNEAKTEEGLKNIGDEVSKALLRTVIRQKGVEEIPRVGNAIKKD